jgi:AAA domain
LNDPAAAEGVEGCTVLNQQHRFGPVINTLANRVAYSGILEPAGDRDVDVDEVVLRDVAGFADEPQQDLHTGRGRTWTAGALTARALAIRHGSAGERVGIVVPYRSQQRLVSSLILDAGLGTNVSVGTSHKFQGREFPVVIFDLVEFVNAGRVLDGWRRSNP